MDNSTNKDISLTTGRSHGNETELMLVEEENLHTMTIVVWTVGGLILILLLSLLGRIILSRNKNLGPEVTHRERSNVFRIRVDMPQYLDCYSSSLWSPSLDTVGLVPSSSPSRNSNTAPVGHQNETVSQHRDIPAQAESSPNENQLQTTSTSPTTVLPPSSSELEVSQQRNGEGSQSTGSHVTLNGIVISPPSYDEVVTSSDRLPYIVVARESRSVPRHQLFSL